MYIVTGGAGFIGSVCVAELNSRGIDDILVVDNLESHGKWQNLVHRSFDDIWSKERFLSAVEEDKLPGRVDALIHLGACSSTTERDADFLLENNFHYSKTLAEWALNRGVRFIYASSAATYGNGEHGFSDSDTVTRRLRPLNMYGYSKQLFDLWALKTGLAEQAAGLKFFNVFGPNEYHKGEMASLVYKAFHQVRDTGRLKLFKSHRPDFVDGEQKRDFVYVKDCVKVIWWLLENRKVNGIFNIGSGAARSWNALASALFAAIGAPNQIDYIDMPESIRSQYQYWTEAETDKLKAAGFTEPFASLEEAVADYVQQHLASADPHL